MVLTTPQAPTPKGELLKAAGNSRLEAAPAETSALGQAESSSQCHEASKPTQLHLYPLVLLLLPVAAAP